MPKYLENSDGARKLGIFVATNMQIHSLEMSREGYSVKNEPIKSILLFLFCTLENDGLILNK